LDLQKSHILLAAISQYPVLDGHENLVIASSGGIVHLSALGIMKGQDHEVSKIHLTLLETLMPIAQDPFNG
jgi:hypothetical protein